MKPRINILLILALAINLNSCQDEDDVAQLEPAPLTCETANTTFSTIYNDILINENLNSYDHVDSPLHAYVFSVSSEKQLCSIGYQSFHEDASVPFDIIIREDATGTIIYSESLLFMQNNMSYASLTPHVVLQPDTDYVLSRIQNDYGTRLNNVIGNVIDGSTNTGTVNFLPYTDYGFTILSTRFYNFNDEEVDVLNFLPQINLVFAE